MCTLNRCGTRWCRDSYGRGIPDPLAADRHSALQEGPVVSAKRPNRRVVSDASDDDWEPEEEEKDQVVVASWLRQLWVRLDKDFLFGA